MSNLTHRFEVKAGTEDGTFKAYGNVFGVIDSANDVTYSGTFARTIQEHKDNKTMPRLLAQHGHSTNPIGIITDMGEDEKGLWFEGKFSLKTQAGAEAYELVKMGALDEFSIGFITLQSENQIIDGVKVRNILDVDLKEISLVTFACNPESKIIDIKSALEDGENVTPRMVRKFLQESGLSRRQADQAIHQIKASNDVTQTKESDVESNENKEVEQKTAETPVAEVKSTSDKMEKKASWWMRETLEDPILSVHCLMDVFYYLPASTHAKILEIAEAGRLEQLAALNGAEEEEKSNSDENIESVGEATVDTETKADDEEESEETESDDDDNEGESEEKEEKSLTSEEVTAWFTQDDE